MCVNRFIASITPLIRAFYQKKGGGMGGILCPDLRCIPPTWNHAERLKTRALNHNLHSKTCQKVPKSANFAIENDQKPIKSRSQRQLSHSIKMGYSSAGSLRKTRL
jgi:hypothetical protein